MRQCLLLTVILFILGFCGIVNAAGGNLPGLGTKDNPYLIEDATDFVVFADAQNAETYWAGGVYVRLTVPLDLSDTIYPTAPIAGDTDAVDFVFEGSQYFGTFDGNRQPISGLTIQATGGVDHLGLFGFAHNATIHDVMLVNTSITATDGSMYAAPLCGYAADCMIDNCSTESSMSLGASCDYVGGFVGYDDQTQILGSFATGNIQTGGSHAGGFCGYNNGIISNCYARGDTAGAGEIGGFCGHNDGGMIQDSYSTGKPIASGQAGGFCALNSGTIDASFWDTTTSETAESDGAVGMETINMHSSSYYYNAGWLFVETFGAAGLWHMPYQVNGYPMLSHQKDIPGDTAGRYGVNFEDFLQLSQCWQTSSGDAAFNPACDLEQIETPGQIVINDIMVLFDHWMAGI